jgi:hypothetical protein
MLPPNAARLELWSATLGDDRDDMKYTGLLDNLGIQVNPNLPPYSKKALEYLDLPEELEGQFPALRQAYERESAERQRILVCAVIDAGKKALSND